MSGIPPGAPTHVDVQRLRWARRQARTAVAAAEARCAADRDAAFRIELAATVRSVSPFLVSLLALKGLTPGEVMARIAPAPGWPYRPRLSRVVAGWGPHALRHTTNAVRRGLPYKEAEILHGFGFCFGIDGRGWALVRVVAHSLEVKATIDRFTFETRFGELLIGIPGRLPLVLAAAVVGRPLDEVVRHPASAGRGWTVDRVETPDTAATIVVVTGETAWRPE